MEAVIFIGIQGAGKSSFYKERFFDTHLRINLDMLKSRHRQELLVRTCLEAKQPFVVDNTNITAETRARFISAAKTAGFHVFGYYFQSTVSEAIARNQKRSGKARVPDKAVWATHQRLELPRMEEGFDELFHVKIGKSGAFQVRKWHED